MAIPLMILADPRNWRAAPVDAYAHGGYQPGGTHKTLSAAVSLGAAALVVAGLATALVAPDKIPFVSGPLVADEIHVLPPPKPPEPEVQRPEETPLTHITTPKPEVDVPTTHTDPIVIPDYVSRDPGPVIIPSSGSGPIADPAPPPQPPAPVYQGPSVNNRFAGSFQPNYPASRQREGVEGRCRVRVTIAPTGRVSAVQNAGCNDDAFFEATQRQALRSWRFNPATRDGVAVEITMEQTVVFRIDQ